MPAAQSHDDAPRERREQWRTAGALRACDRSRSSSVRFCFHKPSAGYRIRNTVTCREHRFYLAALLLFTAMVMFDADQTTGNEHERGSASNIIPDVVADSGVIRRSCDPPVGAGGARLCRADE